MLDGLICPCAALASASTSRRLLVNSVSQGLSGSEITYEVIRTYVRLSGDLTQAAGRTHPKSKTRAPCPIPGPRNWNKIGTNRTFSPRFLKRKSPGFPGLFSYRGDRI